MLESLPQKLGRSSDVGGRDAGLAIVDIVAASPGGSSASKSPAVLQPLVARQPRQRSLWQVALAGLALFALALTSRLIGLEQHLTADDQDWVRRASRFSVALQRGSLRDTYQSGHPGVPVLWLTSLAIEPQRSAELAPLSGNLPVLEKMPSYLPAIFDSRRALAVATATLVAVLALLTWRLLGPGPALLTGLLLVAEPFLVAHDRLFHSDPLLAHLMAISVLTALVHFAGRGGRSYLLGSGLAAGLALLTKAPGILLFIFVPLLGLVWTWCRARRLGMAELQILAAQLALWGLAAGAIYILLWPAVWVDPLGTLNRMVLSIWGQGETPRTWGNFFMGRAIREDPGPLFYPVATLLRLSPITLGGLLVLAWLVDRPGPRKPRPERDIGQAWRPAAAGLLGYLALFTLMMTLSPKKIDRYLLPVFPALVILAALGLWLALRRWRSGPRWAAILALGLGQAAIVTSVQPYPLSFYNPLLGGTGFASRTVAVGWGEGTDQVAAYLDRLPDAPDVVVTSLYHDLLHAQFRGTGVPLAQWQRADYLADYVNMDQRGLVPGPLQPLVREAPPVFTARINGLDYVRLFRIPPELQAQVGPSGAPRRTVPSP